MKLTLFGGISLGLAKVVSALWPNNYGMGQSTLSSSAQLELDNIKHQFCHSTIGDDCLDKAAKLFNQYHGDKFGFSSSELQNNAVVFNKAVEHLKNALSYGSPFDATKRAYINLILAGLYSPFHKAAPGFENGFLHLDTYNKYLEAAQREIPDVVEKYIRAQYVDLSQHDIQNLLLEAKHAVLQKHIRKAAKEGDPVSQLKRAARMISKRHGSTKESDKILNKAVEQDPDLAEIAKKIADRKLSESEIDNAIRATKRNELAPLRR